MQEQLQYLLDRVAIEDTIRSYARGVDRGDFALLRGLFAADARATYAVDDPIDGGDAIVDWLEERTTGMTYSQHVISPVHLTVEGDTAACQAYLVSRQMFEGKDDTLVLMSSTYDFAFRRESEGWRLSELVLRVAWFEEVVAPQDALMQRTSSDVPLAGVADGGA
ncbi:nuclear transport factor 2 family protein [Nitriliruptoraceae bacterium ZYF776]|nr:nuclear transport factor 2 family protein [Profundirhabdus halotolerans]